jgi:hypothetical protein
MTWRVVVADMSLRGKTLRWITRPDPCALARGSSLGGQGESLVPHCTRGSVSLSLTRRRNISSGRPYRRRGGQRGGGVDNVSASPGERAEEEA